ncbi:MAG TPA: 2-C-methyl-D-erythritol 4-phosphate cytidylyltransferase [Firmicutes bacterium]|nr:2-C-methyl-D-erythritol 4-phosphate cytidylyltransferase [Bacillota bacterium]
MKVFANVLAGGKGLRMGNAELPKQFIKIGEKPIIVHTIEKFLMHNQIDAVIVACNVTWIDYMNDLIQKYIPAFSEKIYIVDGGKERNDSLKNSVDFIVDELNSGEEAIILTHDAVRPFISHQIITANIEAMQEYDAVDTVVAAVDTIVHSVEGQIIDEIPNRAEYYQGQTPQTFKVSKLKAVIENVSKEDRRIMTDAAKLFVVNGYSVGLVPGEYSNFKITTQFDLLVAKAMIKE